MLATPAGRWRQGRPGRTPPTATHRQVGAEPNMTAYSHLARAQPSKHTLMPLRGHPVVPRCGRQLTPPLRSPPRSRLSSGSSKTRRASDRRVSRCGVRIRGSRPFMVAAVLVLAVVASLIVYLTVVRETASDRAKVDGPPTTTECAHGPHPSTSDTDPGFSLPTAVLFTEGKHPFDTPSAMYLCQHDGYQGQITVHAPSGVTVSAETIVLDESRAAIHEVQVSVEPGTHARLTFSFVSDGSSGGLSGPHIDSSDDGWSFDIWSDDDN